MLLRSVQDYRSEVEMEQRQAPSCARRQPEEEREGLGGGEPLLNDLVRSRFFDKFKRAHLAAELTEVQGYSDKRQILALEFNLVREASHFLSGSKTCLLWKKHRLISKCHESGNKIISG